MQETSDHINVLGKVTNSIHEIYQVELDNGNTVNGRLSGKLRYNKIQILIGDFVELRISPYDLSHGQIVRRYSEADYRRIKARK